LIPIFFGIDIRNSPVSNHFSLTSFVYYVKYFPFQNPAPLTSFPEMFSNLLLLAALGPSSLNKTGAFQAFSARLTDTTGIITSVSTLCDEPALRFPDGIHEQESLFDGGLFTGRAPMTSISVPLQDFKGVDHRDISEWHWYLNRPFRVPYSLTMLNS
jgi:hypothetical protein